MLISAQERARRKWQHTKEAAADELNEEQLSTILKHAEKRSDNPRGGPGLKMSNKVEETTTSRRQAWKG